jgi:hypothetical protein
MIKTDYLVKGAGASALAFVDVMLRETDATFTIVDRRNTRVRLTSGRGSNRLPSSLLTEPSLASGVPQAPLRYVLLHQPQDA